MDNNFLNQKCYRIALIGSTSSGKTCILSKLSMGHGSNPRLSSTQRPLDCPPLTEDEKAQLDVDESLRMRWNFQNGQERLDEAKTSLKAGQRPQATNRGADVRPMLEFLLGDSEGRGEFYIWTEDYSGELLNVEELKVEDSEAHVLKKRLLQYDGLILVIDTAVTEEQRQKVQKQIENLNQFFATLAEDMKSGKAKLSQIPIALVLSKWDRYATPIEFSSPQAVRQKLVELLKLNPYYDSLIKTIRSSAQEQEAAPTGDLMAGIAYGNTAVFPVSAFGKSVDDFVNGECPDKTCSQAFGIVEPFFWLACRSDDLNILQLEKTFNSTFKWCPQKVKPLLSEAERLKGRINSATETQKRYSAFIEKCKSTCTRLCCFWVVGIILIGLIGYDNILSYNIGQQEMVISNPKTTIEQLDVVRSKLENHKKMFFRGCLLAPSNKRVDADITLVDTRIDDLLWEPVKGATELSKKAELAKIYVDKHPSGEHSKEAWKYINDFRITKEESSWKTVLAASDTSDKAKRAEEYLTLYNGEGTALHAAEAKQFIDDNKIAIEQTSWNTVVTATKDSKNQLDLANQYLIDYPTGKHREEAQKIIQRIGDKRIWDKALAEYNTTKTSGGVPQILSALQGLVSDFGLTEERCLPLVKELPDLIGRKLDTQAQSTTPYNMITKCAEAITAISAFEDVLRSNDGTELASLAVQARQSAENSKQEFIDAYDRDMYGRVRSSKTVDACENYIEKMNAYGGGSMESNVQSYKNYLENKDKKQDYVTVSCSLYWGPQTYVNTKIEATLTVNGKPETYNISSYASDTKSLGSITISNVAPDDKISVGVSLISKGNSYNWNKVNYGTGTDSFYLSELLTYSGKSMPLTDQYNKFGGRLYVTASAPGIPTEPDLPLWTKK